MSDQEDAIKKCEQYVGPIEKLSQYLTENYKLFTLVGVFAGLSIYLTDILARENETNISRSLSVVASFIITGLIGYILIAKLAIKLQSAKRFYSYENWLLIIFGFFFMQLIFVSWDIARQYEEVWSIYESWIVLLLVIPVTVVFIPISRAIFSKLNTLGMTINRGPQIVLSIFLLVVVVFVVDLPPHPSPTVKNRLYYIGYIFVELLLGLCLFLSIANIVDNVRSFVSE